MHSSPLPATSSTPTPLLNPRSLPPFLPPPLLPFFPRSIHLGATLIRVSLFSILHPPCPSRSPANHSFLLIYWLLSACGRAATVSLCSPLHGFVFPFPSFLLPLSLSLHPLHLTIDAAALKHELEKAGESNLPGEIGFIFSCAHFFFLSLTLFGLYLSFSFIFFCVFSFLSPFYLLCFHSNSPTGERKWQDTWHSHLRCFALWLNNDKTCFTFNSVVLRKSKYSY